jgi:hypothetical protein
MTETVLEPDGDDDSTGQGDDEGLPEVEADQ